MCYIKCSNKQKNKQNFSWGVQVALAYKMVQKAFFVRDLVSKSITSEWAGTQETSVAELTINY